MPSVSSSPFNQKGLVGLVIGILGLVLILSIAAGVFVWKKNLPTPQSQALENDEVINSGPETRVVPTELAESPVKDQNWFIRKGDKIIYQASAYSVLNIVRWGDWLLMDKYSDEADARHSQLQGYNTKTGESKVFFTEEDTARNVQTINVINDKLYFATGGYLTQGGVYVISTPTSKPVKIITLPGASIRKEYDGKYFAIGGFGDSCAGSTDINLINSNDKTSPVVKTNYSCGKGTTQIGYVTDKGFLVTESELKDPNGENMDLDGWITQLTSHSVDGKSQVLISKDQMPKHTSYISYTSGLNKLAILAEDGLYIFDLKESKLTKLMVLDRKYYLYSMPLENFICLQDDNNDYFAVDADDKTIKGSKICYDSSGLEENSKQNNQIFNNLNLTSEYTLRLE